MALSLPSNPLRSRMCPGTGQPAHAALAGINFESWTHWSVLACPVCKTRAPIHNVERQHGAFYVFDYHSQHTDFLCPECEKPVWDESDYLCEQCRQHRDEHGIRLHL